MQIQLAAPKDLLSIDMLVILIEIIFVVVDTTMNKSSTYDNCNFQHRPIWGLLSSIEVLVNSQQAFSVSCPVII